MHRYIMPVGFALLTIAAPAYAFEQRPQNVGAQQTTKKSQFYIKGPNAPFKNQQRKLNDPLNANGAGK